MKWKKLGLIFCPDHRYEWMETHAANPVAEPLGGDGFRIYFTSRDKNNRSSIGSLELDLRDPFKILKVSEEPVLSPGEPGLFDDSGAAMGWLTVVDGRKFLYYLGWNLAVTVPWRNSTGLALCPPGQTAFVKYSKAPLLDRSDVDPYSISYPSILIEKGLWRMWYGSNLSWGPTEKDMAHVFKYAESKDGLQWDRKGLVVLPLKPGGEFALSKPCVLKEKGLYRMWYSYRGKGYRIGYAESPDGLTWERKDEEAGIDVSDSGWDSETIEYGYVFDHKGLKYMLYNGNGYGKTGFGLALLEKE